MVRMLFLVAVVLLSSQKVAEAADLPLPLCPTSSRVLGRDSLLRSAVRAAHPRAVEQRATGRGSIDPCIYPYRALRYDGTVVLFTLAGVPGRACHGCSAVVSAVFLDHGRRGLRSVGFHEDFIETGTYGALNAIRPARFGSQNGAVIESGGTFQGISYDIIHPFVFEDEQMKAIGPEEGIPIKSSDCGATESGEPCRDIRGNWRTEGRRLLVRYTGRRGDRTRIDETVVYALRNDELVLIAGADVAAEMRDYRP